ncbi:MAG: DUF1593 domain-containing protein [Alistipes sp.]|nr:DUF1593 domain-containing protein [Alistipes sp.]
MKKRLFSVVVGLATVAFVACQPQPTDEERPRVLISTDIGGTDPDDNQSMAHLLMYSDSFALEGLVSSPSYGEGNKAEILRMIDLYEEDLPTLRTHYPDLMSPEALRAITKQGRKGAAPMCGYADPTEGSEWIVQCAQQPHDEPLYVLVWGGLEDVAQALHDAPEIADRIRIYWIGGPNKKWSVNSYLYIVENHPNLWFIECNAAYRGFIASSGEEPEKESYFDRIIADAGHLGPDFGNYYKGNIKMGDTPSLLYMMQGDASDPTTESWGGQFEPQHHSPRTVFHRPTTEADTVACYSIIEWRFRGPKIDCEVGTPVMTATIDRQPWEGYYLGEGEYMLRYCPKQPALLDYVIASDIKELDGLSGRFTVSGEWPGKPTEEGFQVGDSWMTDVDNPELFEGKWQGAVTVRKWREAVLEDWAERWQVLKPTSER